MNPPLRDAAHQNRPVVGARPRAWSTCSARTTRRIRSKRRREAYPASPSGMPGVQTLVPVMLDHVNAGRLSLARFVDLTSAGRSALLRHCRQGPHRRWLRRRPHHRRSQGRARDRRRTGSAANAAGRPSPARSVTGWPVGTIVRGQPRHVGRRAWARLRGEPVRFGEALPRDPLA